MSVQSELTAGDTFAAAHCGLAPATGSTDSSLCLQGDRGASQCHDLTKRYASLPKVQIWAEWEKLLTKGRDFTGLIEYLSRTDLLLFYPEIAALVGVPQELEWHPEGDCDRHTLLVMSAAAAIADREGLTPFRRLVLVTAALCHDFGKPSTTVQMEKAGRLRWTSHGHEAAGEPMADAFLRRIGAPRRLIAHVRPLVAHHLEHIRFKGGPSKSAIRQVADRVRPATVADLALLVEADASGRPPLPQGLPSTGRLMVDCAIAEGVYEKIDRPLIDRSDVAVLLPDPASNDAVDEVVRAAYRAWLHAKFSTRDEALAWLDRYMRDKHSIVAAGDVLPYFDGHGGKHVGRALDAAWAAQRRGEITNKESAAVWLRLYRGLRDEPN